MYSRLKRLAAGLLLVAGAHAYAGDSGEMNNPLEEAGVIRSIDSASGTITIGTLTMRLSDSLQVSAGEGDIRDLRFSLSWVGQKVGYLWYENEKGQNILTHLHFFHVPQSKAR